LQQRAEFLALLLAVWLQARLLEEEGGFYPFFPAPQQKIVV
jgi:hypothetical protein